MSQSDDTAETTDRDVRLAYLLADVGRWADLDAPAQSRLSAAYLETHPELVAELLHVPSLSALEPYPQLVAAVNDLLGRRVQVDRVWIDGDDHVAVELAEQLSNLAWSHA